MITEIGIIAGEIWRMLDEHEELSINNLVKLTGRSRKHLSMAAGWLAREGHIVMRVDKNEYWLMIRLSERSSMAG